MNIVFWIIVGLIAGWVIEWVIDLLFWRRRGPAQDQPKLERLAALESEASACRAKLADAEATIDQLRAELNALAGQIPSPHDRLERVKGIGTVFARRLNQAGVTSFAQLAQLTPQRIREIIRPEEWQKIEPEVWIAEAKEFAAQADSAAQGG